MRFVPFVLAVTVLAGTSNMNGKYSVASGARQDVAFNDDYAVRAIFNAVPLARAAGQRSSV